MVETIQEILNDKNALNNITKLAFENLVTNKSGRLEMQELENIMARISDNMGVEPLEKKDIEKIFKGIDKDNNGTLDYGELKILIYRILFSLINNEKKEENEEDIDI